MAKRKSAPTKAVTGKVRFAYANVFKAVALVEGNEAKYGVCLIVPKEDKDTLKKLKAGIDAAKESGAKLWGGKIPSGLKTPIRDGDDERPDQEEFEGAYFLNANSLQKPGLVDADMNEIFDATEFYSGCYGRASVNFFPYSVGGSKGIACGLNNLQKLADGENLVGRTKPEDDFGDDFEDDEDDFLS